MKVRCNQCMKVFDEEKIVYDGEDDMEYCPECGESGCLMDIAATRYYVCGLGYDEELDAIDYEIGFGDFDTYEEAYELFVKLQCRNDESFFVDSPDVYEIDIRIEECEETEDGVECVDVKNEWGIINPNYKKCTMNREQFVNYVHDNFNVSIEFLRLLDNVLHYVELQGWCEDEIYDYLDFMLDCNIGLEDAEIRQINFKEEV